MTAHCTRQIHHAGPDLFENKKLVWVFGGAFLEEGFLSFLLFPLHFAECGLGLFGGGGDVELLIIQDDGGRLLFCQFILDDRAGLSSRFFAVAVDTPAISIVKRIAVKRSHS